MGSVENDERGKEILIRYLSQYYRFFKRKEILEKRLTTFRLHTLGAKTQKLSSMPRSCTNNITDECSDFLIKEEEILDRIAEERRNAASAMLKVIDMLDFLPKDTDERNILELKYLDNMQWMEIAQAQCMSKSRCIDYWNLGLQHLLEYKKVRVTLERYLVEQETESKKQKKI